MCASEKVNECTRKCNEKEQKKKKKTATVTAFPFHSIPLKMAVDSVAATLAGVFSCFCTVSAEHCLACGHNIQIIHANTKCKAHFLLVLMVRFGRLSPYSHHATAKYSNGMHNN